MKVRGLSSLRRKTTLFVRIIKLNQIQTLIKLFYGISRNKAWLLSLRFSENIKIIIRTNLIDLRVVFTIIDHEMPELSRYLPEDFAGIFVDGGAHIGAVSVILNCRYPQARVLAIEPDDENFHILEMNVQKMENVTAIHAAIVGHKFTETIPFYDVNSGSWAFTTEPRLRENAIVKGEVKAITLSEIKRQYGIELFDVVKLDIEGAELELLESSQWLEDVDILYIKLHTRFNPEIRNAFLRATTHRKNIESIENEKIISLKIES